MATLGQPSTSLECDRDTQVREGGEGIDIEILYRHSSVCVLVCVHVRVLGVATCSVLPAGICVCDLYVCV